MPFNTITFAVFFGVLVMLLAFIRADRSQKWLYFLASCVFYMWWNPAFILLILFSTVVDYYLGERIAGTEDRTRAKRYLIASVVINLGVLAFFKYAGFLSENLLLLARWLGYSPSWTELNVLLPVGISFYTFQTMSYSIDLYRGNIKPSRNLLDFAVFVSFFPQLVAGPIVRAADFLPQLDRPRKLDFSRPHLLLILKGLFKKAVIADNLGTFVATIYDSPEAYPSVIIWLATLCFAVQIYCDFSGYTDIAIGVAAMIGFTFPDNFNRPYFAATPSDFWRRWHISLSSWLRDYLYISLGGNRGGSWLTYRNLMLTMLLGGLWHGASWNFVLWGFLHGLILVVFRIFRLDKFVFSPTAGWLRKWTFVLLMQIFVLFTWIAFRQTDPERMLITMRKFLFFDFNFAIQSIGLGNLAFFSTVLILFAFWAGHLYAFFRGGIEQRWAHRTPLTLVPLLTLTGAAMYFFWPSTEAPFIYFQF